jgi:hypothetical protein
MQKKGNHQREIIKLNRPTTLNASYLFASDNKYGIPMMRRDIFTSLPKFLVPYRTRVTDEERIENTAVHFFLDDHRFDSVWNKPEQSLNVIGPYQTVLSPDFSLYPDWPLVMQIWNTYRSRWCGAYWQSNGLSVIPTISWSNRDSYEFCFLGVPNRSCVAVSTVGVNLKNTNEYFLFMAGFKEMIKQINPPTVICYGPAPKACFNLANIEQHLTRWQKIRKDRQAKKQLYMEVTYHGR